MTKNLIRQEKEKAYVLTGGKTISAGGVESAIFTGDTAPAFSRKSTGTAESVSSAYSRKSTDDPRQSEIEKLGDEWDEAGIGNAFLFGKIMTTRQDILLELLQYSLPEMGITSIDAAGREVDIKLSIDSHGVRLDVSARDDAGRIIDIEMQLKDEQNVPRRMRYYSGAIDQTVLEKGMNYSRLSDTVVLFITMFDPFGKDHIRYSFRNICLEDRELELGDGTTKIVLNAVGTKGDVPEELKGFLNLVAGNMDVKKDSFAGRVQKQVMIARKNPEWRRQYMEWKMTLLNEREKGREEGREEGVILDRIDTVERKMQKGLDLPEIADAMEKDIEAIRPIWDAVRQAAPTHDREAILQAIRSRETQKRRCQAP